MKNYFSIGTREKKQSKKRAAMGMGFYRVISRQKVSHARAGKRNARKNIQDTKNIRARFAYNNFARIVSVYFPTNFRTGKKSLQKCFMRNKRAVFGASIAFVLCLRQAKKVLCMALEIVV